MTIFLTALQAMVASMATPPGYHQVETVGAWQILTNDNDSGSCVMAGQWDDGTTIYFGPSQKAGGTVITVARLNWTAEDVGANYQDTKMQVSFGDDEPKYDLPGLAMNVGNTHMVGGLVPDQQFLRKMAKSAEVSFIVGPHGNIAIVPLNNSGAAMRAVVRCEAARQATR